MQHITTQTIRQCRGDQFVVSVQVNSGSIAVEVEHVAGTWLVADSITADFVGPMYYGHARVRFTPTGGATLTLHTPQ